MNHESQGSLFGDPRQPDRVTSAIANIDGGSRGNPGPAAFGAYIALPDGRAIEVKGFIPHSTNNVAEYNGLLAALRWAVEHGVRTLHIRADSELLVKQMKGVYRVKNPGLLPLYEEAKRLARQVGQVTFEHVRRELNKDADRLCNEAMDEAETERGLPKNDCSELRSTEWAGMLRAFTVGWAPARRTAIVG